MKIVLATHNRDKVKEIAAIMASIDVELVLPEAVEGMPDVVEDGETLEANALKKAREIRDFTGCHALADDTGLEVDALDGGPGVYSARYAGENATYDDNNTKLLRELDGVPPDKRTAQFRCVMALALANKSSKMRYNRGDALVTEGILAGRIAEQKRGEHGFGFDPVFEVPQEGKTLAEMTLEAKNEISHRYRALVEMREMILRMNLADTR